MKTWKVIFNNNDYYQLSFIGYLSIIHIDYCYSLPLASHRTETETEKRSGNQARKHLIQELSDCKIQKALPELFHSIKAL